MNNKEYILSYDTETPETGDDIMYFVKTERIPDDGWEHWSLPIGCGHFGASLFGRVMHDRIQITENSLVTAWVPSPDNKYEGRRGGLTNFCELFLDFDHADVCDYKRSLSLNDAVSTLSYRYDGKEYTRQYFASYPDKVLVVSLGCSEKGSLSFVMRPEQPFGGKDKTDTYFDIEGNTVTFGGKFGTYEVKYESIFRLFTIGGKVEKNGNTLAVKNAHSAYIIGTFGTNYKLQSSVFTCDNGSKKLEGFAHPHQKLSAIMDKASKYSLCQLKERHIADYKSLFDRVAIDFGGVNDDITTDKLLENYKNGKQSRYLEELYFQYGRYLLISSSRPGTLPCNLQGTWSKYISPCWGSGYWHNVNIQMNYWPAFVTNLFETFLPYMDYCEAYMDKAETIADYYIKCLYPQRLSSEKGGNGWAIGTACWPYSIGAPSPHSHSGPGTGGFTTMLLWEAYTFSGDTELLKDRVYKPLKSMARFLEKNLVEIDGKWLVEYSASPEQKHNGEDYHTVGCAFDQMMIWECFHETILAAEILGDNDKFIRLLKSKIDLLDPIQVGLDGQIKEFREEEHYGDIGEYHHRHISHLVSAYPGVLINKNTPALLKAVERTLELRGDKSTGWAMAHRLCTWARVGNGNRAHKVYSTLLSQGTLENLWDTHPPFQIDGNFGGTSGVAEMLIQSHAGYVELIPCLPDVWNAGSFKGLFARGGFVVDAVWQNGKLTQANVLSNNGGEFRLMHKCEVKDTSFTYDGKITRFMTEKGKEYRIVF